MSVQSAHSGSSDGGGMYDRRFSSEKHPRSYGDGGGGFGPDYHGQYRGGRGGGRGGGGDGGRFSPKSGSGSTFPSPNKK